MPWRELGYHMGIRARLLDVVEVACGSASRLLAGAQARLVELWALRASQPVGASLPSSCFGYPYALALVTTSTYYLPVPTRSLGLMYLRGSVPTRYVYIERGGNDVRTQSRRDRQALAPDDLRTLLPWEAALSSARGTHSWVERGDGVLVAISSGINTLESYARALPCVPGCATHGRGAPGPKA